MAWLSISNKTFTEKKRKEGYTTKNSRSIKSSDKKEGSPPLALNGDLDGVSNRSPGLGKLTKSEKRRKNIAVNVP